MNTEQKINTKDGSASDKKGFDIRDGVLVRYEGKGVRDVRVPDGVRSVGISAFSSNTEIESVYLPDSVTAISRDAFAFCKSLRSVRLPDGLDTVPYGAFNCCSALTDIVLPDSVKVIEGSAFTSCSNLTSVTLGKDLETIEDFITFYECDSLVEIINRSSLELSAGSKRADGGIAAHARLIHTGKSRIDNSHGFLFFTDSEGDGRHYLLGYDGQPDTLTLPESYRGERYAIHAGAFRGAKNITSFRLPPDLLAIGEQAFDGTGFLEAARKNTKNDAVYLDGYLIASPKLGEISGEFTVKDGTHGIADGALAFQNITQLTVPSGLLFIGKGALSMCNSLKRLSVPTLSDWISLDFEADELGFDMDYDWLYIDGKPFASEEITVPEGIKRIGSYKFKDAAVSVLTLPASLESIGYGAFSGCDIEEIRYPDLDSLCRIKIEGNAPNAERLKVAGAEPTGELHLPDGLTCLRAGAFVGCGRLTAVYIPDSLKRIDRDAFKDCSALERVYIDSEEHWLSIRFGNNYANPMLYAGSLLSDGKPLLTGSLTLPDTLTDISCLLCGCRELVSVKLPPSLEIIGSSAFEDCSALTSVILPDGVTEIGESAFSGCSALNSLNLPKGLKRIGASAFCGCEALRDIALPDGLTEMGRNAFGGCDALEEIALPASLSALPDYAFEQCASLRRISVPASVSSIGALAFLKCRSLTDIVLENGIKSVGAAAFSGCTALKRLTIPQSVTSIGYLSLYNCASLEALTVPFVGGGLPENDSFSAFSEYAMTSGRLGWLFNNLDPEGFSPTFISPTLRELTVTGGEKLCERALEGFSSLEAVILPKTLISVEKEAFRGCTGITDLVIPESVTSVGEDAFIGCDSLFGLEFKDIRGWKINKKLFPPRLSSPSRNAARFKRGYPEMTK